MKRFASFLFACFTALTLWATDPFVDGNANSSALADRVRLSARVVENVYLMPEQITKLIFPKPVDEVSVNTQVINIGRNPADSKEHYLLLSPKVASADVNMHVTMDGTTYSLRLIVGKEKVNYRKTYTVEGGGAGHNLSKVPALAPTEINTTRLINLINQMRRDPNYAELVAKDMGFSPQGTTYLWNGAEVTLQSAWHYYPQDVVILQIEVHNPTSEAVYLSATQIEPFIANTEFPYLLTQQGTKVLLPGQTDLKYIFLQGQRIDIENARFELRLPANRTQLKETPAPNAVP
ncbi:MAG: hypothetical protein ABS95_01240 [Verrucomicrobia bacterium SCN 57-15]|nr:MAG: hypothetical protein ABS95_01240 [Verrucomicrobia bacterium SCN 57-15]